MHTRPGAGSLLATAGGWEFAAAELATSQWIGAVRTAALHWRGPAAESICDDGRSSVSCTTFERHGKRSKPGAAALR